MVVHAGVLGLLGWPKLVPATFTGHLHRPKLVPTKLVPATFTGYLHRFFLR